jgi:hypothetical protein
MDNATDDSVNESMEFKRRRSDELADIYRILGENSSDIKSNKHNIQQLWAEHNAHEKASSIRHNETTREFDLKVNQLTESMNAFSKQLDIYMAVQAQASSSKEKESNHTWVIVLAILGGCGSVIGFLFVMNQYFETKFASKDTVTTTSIQDDGSARLRHNFELQSDVIDKLEQQIEILNGKRVIKNSR